eukprot:g4427.t1
MKDLLEKERKEHKQRFTRDAARAHPDYATSIQVAEKVNIKGAEQKPVKRAIVASVKPVKNPRPAVSSYSPLATLTPGVHLPSGEGEDRSRAGSLPLSMTNPGFLSLNESVMPLEAFDNAIFETKSPEEWLAVCKTGKTPYYTNAGSSGGSWRWRACSILSYDAEARRFEVEIQGLNPRRKAVKRLDLMFDLEDPDQFKARLQAARDYRERFKEALRLRSFLEKSYDGDVHPLQKKWIKNIFRRSSAKKPYSGTVKGVIAEVQKAIVGLVVMSQELEDMGNSMVNGWVPELWKAVAYPSLKPLGSWVNDLLERVKFFDDWLANDRPVVNWLSGFFFTPSFLTGTLQNFARKETIAIDELGFEFEVLSPEQIASLDSRPDNGAYIRGLFLQGAAWSTKEGCLVDSRPKELFCEVPVIWLIPKKMDEIKQGHRYICPVYKTSERKGMLSTTGHSTNFVLYVMLPMSPEHVEKHHIKGGVACITQLDS